MATDIDEAFEGGTNGATLTTGNTGFASITGSPTFDNTHVARGSLAMKCVASASTVLGARTYTTRAVTFVRAYIYLESMPGANLFILGVQNSATIRAQIRIDATGSKLTMRNGTTAVYTTTTSLSANTLYRVEWRVDNTASQQQVRLYSGHSSSALEDSGNQTYNQGTHDRTNVGVVASGTGTIWVDDFASGDTTWFGPSQTGTDATATPLAVAQSVTVPAPSMSTGSTVTPSAVARAVATPSATVTGGTAADISETFESGTNGAAITAANTGFTVVGGSPTFTSAAIVGALAMEVSATAATEYGSIQYTARNVTYTRFYFRTPSAAPAAITYLANLQSGATIRAQFRLNVAMTVSLRNGTTAVWTSGPTLSTDTVYRAEWRVDNSTSQQQLRIYVLHSTTPTIDSGNQTYDQGTHDRALVGVVASATLTYQIDDVEVRPDTWPGPSVTGSDATPTPASVAAAVVAPPPILSTGVTATPAAVARAAVAEVPSMSTGSTLTPASVDRSAVVAAPTVTAGVTASVAAISRAVVTPAPTTQTTQGGTAVPAAVSRAVVIPAFAAEVGVMVDPAAVHGTAAVPAPGIVTDATVTASAVTRPVVVPVPQLTSNQVVTPPALSLGATFPAAVASAVQRLSSPASLASWQARWDAVPHPTPNGSVGTGWVGGGGGWSATHPSSESAVFLFGDSPVIAEGGGHNFPHNSAILWTEADGFRLVGAPFIPGDGDGSWYGGGPVAMVGGDLYVFAPKRDTSGDLGTTLFRYTWPASFQAPVYAEKLDTIPVTITWGAAVVEYGSYVYIFGSYKDPGSNSSRLYLARTLTASLAASPTGWDYLTPSGWDNAGSHLTSTTGLQAIVDDTPGVDELLSVHAHAGGLRMVSKAGGGLGPDVTIWDATDATGPWTPRVVAQAPSGTPTSSDITFSAVGHFNLPALPNGQVLLSVSRNRFGVSLEDFFPDPSFYRPLWFEADGSITRVFPDASELSASIPAPNPTVSRTATPAAVARAAVVAPATLSTASTPSPAPVTAAVSVAAAAVQTGATLTAQPLSHLAQIPTPALLGSTTVTATAAAAVSVVPGGVIDSTVTLAPTVVLVPTTVPIPDSVASSTFTATAIGRTVGLPAADVVAVSNATITPDEVSRAVAIPEILFQAGGVVGAAAVVVAVQVPAPHAVSKPGGGSLRGSSSVRPVPQLRGGTR